MGLTRDVPAGLLAVLDGPFFPVVLVEIDWPDGIVRMHTGVGTIAWDSVDWSGVGDLAALGVPEETVGLPPTRATLQLAGPLEDVLARLDDDVRGRGVRVLVGAVTTPAGATLVADPVEMFAGTLDTLAWEWAEIDGGDRASVLETEIRTGPGARSAARITHSREDQAAAHSGDTAGRHIEQLRTQVATLTWPE